VGREVNKNCPAMGFLVWLKMKYNREMKFKITTKGLVVPIKLSVCLLIQSLPREAN